MWRKLLPVLLSRSMLREHGLPASVLNMLFKSLVLSKLTYTSPVWWGHTLHQNRVRLEGFLHKANKSGFHAAGVTFSATCEDADQKFFSTIVNNPNHVLTQLLPPPVLSRRPGLRDC